MVAEAYEDPRFDHGSDQAFTDRSRAVMCAPINDRQGVLIGVVEVINPAGGTFSEDDLDLFDALAAQVGICALANQ